jgi:hypothetical protein
MPDSGLDEQLNGVLGSITHNVPAPSSNDTLSRIFINAVRGACFEDRRPHLGAAEIIRIVENSACRASLTRIIQQEINDPDLRQYIVSFLDETADQYDDEVDFADAGIDLIDRSGLPIATAATVAGIGMLVTIGVTVGPVLLVGCGMAALALCVIGRTGVRLSGNGSKSIARKIRRFADDVRKFGGSPTMLENSAFRRRCRERDMMMLTSADIVLSALGLIVAVWCAGLVSYTILTTNRRRRFSLDRLVRDFATLLIDQGEALRRTRKIPGK